MATTALLAVLIVAGCASSATAAKDVSVGSCAVAATGGHPTASGQVLNHSSKSSAYTIHVSFSDASGNGVGDGVAVVAKVDPHTTANWHANGDLTAKGALKCKLSSVSRVAVP